MNIVEKNVKNDKLEIKLETSLDLKSPKIDLPLGIINN